MSRELSPFRQKLKYRWEQALRRPRLVVLRLFRSTRWLASLYLNIFRRDFGREHRAVLHGMYRYEAAEANRAGNSALLRRNIHRIEKGLIMRPRRPVFAVGFLLETLDAYERILGDEPAQTDIAELQWAHDVLQAYFTACESHPVVDEARERFFALPPAPVHDDKARYRPYARDLRDNPVAYDAFYALSRRRRSVRWFLDRPVSRELIDQALLAAAEAPSACNRQPYVFRIFDEPEIVQQVASLPMGTRGFAHNFPAIAVVVGQLRAYFDPRDRHVIYIDGSLAAMGFMYALETLGLSSCPINWPDIPKREAAMQRLLGLEDDQRPIMLIAFGYPDPEAEVAYSRKRSLERLRSYNNTATKGGSKASGQ